MITRDGLRRVEPPVDSAAARFLRGEITHGEYQRLVAQERDQERRPAAPYGRRSVGDPSPADAT